MKKMNKKGFTLAELLIVVAIIAVLVAVAIPVFNAQLEKSRDATTIANLRSAYAEATTVMLQGNTDGIPNATYTAASGTASASVAIASVNWQDTDGSMQEASNLPFTMPSSYTGGKGTRTVTFTFDASGNVTAAIA